MTYVKIDNTTVKGDLQIELTQLLKKTKQNLYFLKTNEGVPVDVRVGNFSLSEDAAKISIIYRITISEALTWLMDRLYITEAYWIRRYLNKPTYCNDSGLEAVLAHVDAHYLDLQMGNLVYEPYYPLEWRFREADKLSTEIIFQNEHQKEGLLPSTGWSASEYYKFAAGMIFPAVFVGMLLWRRQLSGKTNIEDFKFESDDSVYYLQGWHPGVLGEKVIIVESAVPGGPKLMLPQKQFISGPNLQVSFYHSNGCCTLTYKATVP